MLTPINGVLTHAWKTEYIGPLSVHKRAAAWGPNSELLYQYEARVTPIKSMAFFCITE